MKSDRQLPVAIIGGGFSGTMAAAQLARLGIPAILIEGGGRSGLGAAYSTREAAHLLNVRAGNMSAWPDPPDHFTQFLERNDQGGESDFAQRRLFGRYLQGILAEAIDSGRVELAEGKAVMARRDGDGWQVSLENGESIAASALVLAIGNQPPEPPAVAAQGNGRYVDNPWSEAAQQAVAAAAREGGDVLLIGTGLTMVDLALSLEEAGHDGRILALSRRGQIPRAHAESEPAELDPGEIPQSNVRALWHWLRQQSAKCGWRSVLDGLRPHSHSLWQALPEAEQRRFLRHARPWWDVHRHRIAPEVAERIRGMIADGRLEVAAARILATTEEDDGVSVRYRRRGETVERQARFGHVFNCTGPLGAIARTGDPLLRQLLDDGMARPDALGIGIAVDDRSRVAGATKLWALGPLTKGRFWEIVAVPDIRVQAADVAEDIARELGR